MDDVVEGPYEGQQLKFVGGFGPHTLVSPDDPDSGEIWVKASEIVAIRDMVLGVSSGSGVSVHVILKEGSTLEEVWDAASGFEVYAGTQSPPESVVTEYEALDQVWESMSDLPSSTLEHQPAEKAPKIQDEVRDAAKLPEQEDESKSIVMPWDSIESTPKSQAEANPVAGNQPTVKKEDGIGAQENLVSPELYSETPVQAPESAGPDQFQATESLSSADMLDVMEKISGELAKDKEKKEEPKETVVEVQTEVLQLATVKSEGRLKKYRKPLLILSGLMVVLLLGAAGVKSGKFQEWIGIVKLKFSDAVSKPAEKDSKEIKKPKLAEKPKPPTKVIKMTSKTKPKTKRRSPAVVRKTRKVKRVVKKLKSQKYVLPGVPSPQLDTSQFKMPEESEENFVKNDVKVRVGSPEAVKSAGIQGDTGPDDSLKTQQSSVEKGPPLQGKSTDSGRSEPKDDPHQKEASSLVDQSGMNEDEKSKSEEDLASAKDSKQEITKEERKKNKKQKKLERQFKDAEWLNQTGWGQ